MGPAGVSGNYLQEYNSKVRAKPQHRPRQGTKAKLHPSHFLHTNANNWNGAQKALEAAQYERPIEAQYERPIDVLTVADHRLRGTALEDVKERSQAQGWAVYPTPCKRTGDHQLSTCGGVSIHV
eukprot:4175864-Amphidinium_carterae.1